jgi:hypothetical protein
METKAITPPQAAIQWSKIMKLHHLLLMIFCAASAIVPAYADPADAKPSDGATAPTEAIKGMERLEAEYPGYLQQLEKLADTKAAQKMSPAEAKEFLAKIKTLQVGMTPERVTEIFGKPDRENISTPRIPSYETPGRVCFYYYLYRVENGDAEVSVGDIAITFTFMFPGYPDPQAASLAEISSRTLTRGLMPNGRKDKIQLPLREKTNGKTIGLFFPADFSIDHFEEFSSNFLVRIIPEKRTENRILLAARALRSGREGDAPTDPLLCNPDGSIRQYPFKLEWLKDETDLEVLDLSGLAQVELDGTRLPKLRVLKLNGQIAGLEKLDLPALETLELGGTPQPPDGKIHQRLPSRFEQPTFPDTAPLQLSHHLPQLREFILNTPKFADFDFSSLAGRNLRKVLIIFCTGSDLKALNGQPITDLRVHIYDKENSENPGSLLKSLPLERLSIGGHISDLSFLRGQIDSDAVPENGKAAAGDARPMRLRELTLSLSAKTFFSPEWLRGMPLKKLRVYGHSKGSYDDWSVLKELPLEELTLSNTKIADPAALAGLPLERLYLDWCYFKKPGVLEAVAELPKLKMLHLGSVFYLPDAQGEPALLNRDLKWELLKRLPITVLSYEGTRADFVKEFASLEYLKIDDLTEDSSIKPEDAKRTNPLNLLVLSQIRNINLMKPEKNILFQSRKPYRPDVAVRIIWNKREIADPMSKAR